MKPRGPGQVATKALDNTPDNFLLLVHYVLFLSSLGQPHFDPDPWVIPREYLVWLRQQIFDRNQWVLPPENRSHAEARASSSVAPPADWQLQLLEDEYKALRKRKPPRK
jgi:hypothetical protein